MTFSCLPILILAIIMFVFYMPKALFDAFKNRDKEKDEKDNKK